MTTLESGFERKLEAAVLESVEREADAIGEAFKADVEERFRAYADRNDYDVDHIWEDADLVVERSPSEVRIRVEWPELTALFEFGVSPHVIRGRPKLAFVWKGAPSDVKRQYGDPPFMVTDAVNWGSVTGGIPAARAIRDGLQAMQARLQRRGSGGRFR